ncbi:MAG: hypothetical protein AAB225_31070 [Acidobacteriota bacterium]
MSSASEQPRRLAAAAPGYEFGALAWSPDARHIAYLKRSRQDEQFAIESYDLITGQTTAVLSDRRLRHFCWARDGRIVFGRLESPPGETSSNLWEIRVDPRTAKPRNEARRLTNWGGFQFSYLGISDDGRRLAFLRWHWQSDVYLAELENGGTRLSKPRRLTLDERIDWPGGWTRDSKALLFYSDRNGELDIFKQDVTARAAAAVAPGPEEKREPRLSPDGAWILYLAWAKGGDRARQGRLMRVHASGGAPQTVFGVKGYPGSARISPETRIVLSTGGHPRFRCPSVPGTACVLSEQDQRQLVFSAFDPAEGTKREFTRIEVDPSTVAFWDLSPDGRWIAFGATDEQSGSIRVLSLAGRTIQDMSVKGWTHLESVAWSADGKGLFLTSFDSRGRRLLRASLTGETRLLYAARSHLTNPSPSPDGRHLAFGEVTPSSNAWVIENLR